MWVPPGGSEAIEVGDFGGVDGGASGAVVAGGLGRHSTKLMGVLGRECPDAGRQSGERS